VGDLFEQFVERIAADSEAFRVERARELVETGVFTAEAALEAKLIDAVAYDDEVAAALSGGSRPRPARCRRRSCGTMPSRKWTRIFPASAAS